MTTEEAMESLGLSRTGLSSLANRHKLGRLRVGKDGKAHRHFSESDLDFMRARIGKRGRPPKPETSLGQAETPKVERRSDDEQS
jgi:hypothetical protein